MYLEFAPVRFLGIKQLRRAGYFYLEMLDNLITKGILHSVTLKGMQ